MHHTRLGPALMSTLIVATLMALALHQPAPESSAAPGKLIMGYAASWSISGRADAASLDGNKFTHLIYAFLGISGNSCTEQWTDPESSPPTTTDATKMTNIVLGLNDNKSENPGLKVLLSIGGGGYKHGFEGITDYAAFAKSCYDLMIKHKADGLDFDYEFPENDAGRIRHRDLIAALRSKLGSQYLLTVGLPASSWYGQWIDAAAIQPNVNYFTTMAYNYHGSWESSVHFNSPATGCADGSGLCMTATASYWSATRGLPKSKIVIGLGLYGNRYTTWSDGCTTVVGSSGYSAWTTIDYKTMRTNGMLSGSRQAGSGWRRDYNVTYQNAALCSGSASGNASGRTWIGYEDPDSARWRATWLRDNSYPGLMIWEVFKDHNSEMLNAVCEIFSCPASSPAPTATRTPTSSGATATRTPTSSSAPTATRTPTASSGASAWAPGVAYAANQLVTYAGVTYRCITAHTSQTGWEPPNVPALWARV